MVPLLENPVIDGLNAKSGGVEWSLPRCVGWDVQGQYFFISMDG
jgi:hypothetical protein